MKGNNLQTTLHLEENKRTPIQIIGATAEYHLKDECSVVKSDYEDLLWEISLNTVTLY